MTHPNSQIIIVPDARWPVLRAWFLTQGFEIGAGVPLSQTGELPVTHRALHSWMTDALIASAEANAPRPWQSDVASDSNGQSDKQGRWSVLRAGKIPIGSNEPLQTQGSLTTPAQAG